MVATALADRAEPLGGVAVMTLCGQCRVHRCWTLD